MTDFELKEINAIWQKHYDTGDNITIEGNSIVIHDEDDDVTEAVISVKSLSVRDVVLALCDWLGEQKEKETKDLLFKMKALDQSTNMTKLKLYDFGLSLK